MEILSPAGSFASLEAAVNYGADAVYVGGERFSARKSAQNFTNRELEQAADYCHVRGARLYVCCNTLMKETELEAAMEFIRFTYAIGADALIVQDMGLLARVRRELPDFPVHGSTQMTVVNSEGVNALAALGVKRVVLAREVTKEELASIRAGTRTELEYFVHGALCISYSGQCLMSSLLGGRSGNRGGCAQPCRLPYTLLENGRPVTDTAALLCPKDLCLADEVQTLAAMGVTSLKIEGRMKSPEYVAMATQIYKSAAEGKVTESDIRDMLKFFSRGGSCQGYFHGCSYSQMMDMAGSSKIAPTLPAIEKQERRMPVSISFTGCAGRPLRLAMTAADGTAASVTGEACQPAHTRATEAERVREQLGKLGETPFYAKQVEVQLSADAAIPVKSMNALRRQAAELLEAQLAGRFKRQLPKETVSAVTVAVPVKGAPALCAEVMTHEQLQAALDMGIERIYFPEALAGKASAVPEPVLQLAPLHREGQLVEADSFASVCIQNIGQLGAVHGRSVTAGHRLNVTNSESAGQLAAMGVSRVVVSPELNLKAILAMRRQTALPLEVIVYGHLPLMLLRSCVIKSAYRCRCENGGFALRDRKNEIFPLLPLRCGNVLYNSKPVYMADRLEDIKNLQIEGIRLSFTLENYERCCIIIREYQEALAGKAPQAPAGEFTRGHFYRGMQ